MQKAQAQNLVRETLQNDFDKERFLYFVKNLLNKIDETKTFNYTGVYISEAFRPFVKSYERIGQYIDLENNKIDVLIVYLQKETSLERARTAQRNFVARYLKDRDQKEAGLVAFVSPDPADWRFSLVKMEYKFTEDKSGKTKVKEEFTPAKRWSFLVGKNENSHTAQSRLAPIVEDDQTNPTLKQLEDAFNIEKVTKEFFEKYRDLFLRTADALKELVEKDEKLRKDFEEKSVIIADFTKKLLGQIVFLYFLQKKGWFGVEQGKEWGTGSKRFMRDLFEGKIIAYGNFFNDVLEHLFYDALARDRSDIDHFNPHFNCKIPFLNGGLFDPINGYSWEKTEINLPNDLFSNEFLTKEKDKGTGILDIFDRYNFTVKEDEPLEKEVAVDPEMLGKVFENLLEVKDRKSKGTYYTPREIVHYMCEQSLVNYLATELEGKVSKEDLEKLIKIGENVVELEAVSISKEDNPEYGGDYKRLLPDSIKEFARQIDDKLATIKVCDPAIGSGAFPVGMMNVIVKARMVLSSYMKDKNRTLYSFKRDCIQNSLYGVDIDPGAVEIAKLRLWLSLVVDEDNIKQIKPLPNLDYKIMQGNSLLEEFEGIQLFDEKLIAVIDDSREKQLESLKQKQAILQKEYFELHSQNKLTPVKQAELNNEAKKLQAQVKKLNQPEKVTAENVGLFDVYSEAKKKADDLKRLHKEFFEATQKGKKDEIKKQIEQLEWELIEATLKEQNKVSALKKLEEFKRSNTKPFFLWKLNFADVFEEKGGFDVVMANPPYVRQEEIEDKPALQGEYKIYNAVADLYTYFYEKGFELLKSSGVLTFITSNKFLRARYGISLRDYLKNNLTIKNVINFGDKHMFEAITNTLILIATKEKTDGNYLSFSDDINEPNKIKFFQDELRSSEWTIENAEVIRLKNKIEKLGKPLSGWDIKINRGVLTGYNEAFVIDGETKNELIKKDAKSKEIIKPIIRGRDIGRYHHRDSGLYLTNIHNGYKLADGSKVEAVDINDYHAIKVHLDQWQDKLKERQDKGKTIYNLRDCAFIQDFSKEKIIWIELTNINKFAYSNKEDYLLAGAFFMVGESLKYLLAFLNSKLCLFYFSLICNSSGMATIQWKKFALEKVPVKELSEKDQKPFVNLVEEVLEITKESDYLKNAEKQAKVQDLEHQIDELVYKLYGLTEEEKEIIKNAS